ncbi:hypothetical protein COLO4_19967 [Corchorus olitorius]|uniref:Uncharacterized protein n=1 Tax=Corchorus olitorius TaxID=93759 RepID=A0A1R3J2J8_9ROSI|nr:hypothetical protein COLO4_19967 [Corchorus olitorius]
MAIRITIVDSIATFTQPKFSSIDKFIIISIQRNTKNN